jgi:hypothetical protein
MALTLSMKFCVHRSLLEVPLPHIMPPSNLNLVYDVHVCLHLVERVLVLTISFRGSFDRIKHRISWTTAIFQEKQLDCCYQMHINKFCLEHTTAHHQIHFDLVNIKTFGDIMKRSRTVWDDNCKFDGIYCYVVFILLYVVFILCWILFVRFVQRQGSI